MGGFVLAEFALVGDADRLTASRGGRDADAVGAQRRRRQVEERRRQANGQVGRRHLVDAGERRHVAEE